MERAYTHECTLALVAFGVVTLLTHIYPMYFLFPELTKLTILGYPAHYLLTIIFGWLVLIPLYWIYIILSEKIDAEIQETSALAEDAERRKKIEAESAVAAGGAE